MMNKEMMNYMQITNFKLTEEECRWFSLVLAVPNPFAEVMYRQIEKAEVQREYTEFYIMLRLFHSSDMELLPEFAKRVPITMIVQHNSEIAHEKSVICYQENYSMDCIQGDQGEWPTEFLLHVYDGFVKELEIYNVDISKLDRNRICSGRKDYSIIPELMCK